MNGDLGLEVKQSVFKICKGDVALAELLDGRVFTWVPDKSLFPYVRIADLIGAPGGTKTSPGQELTVTLNCFSREKGDLEIDKIMRRLNALFHEQKLRLDAGTVGVCRYLSSIIKPDPDGITRQGVVRFRMNTYEDNPS